MVSMNKRIARLRWPVLAVGLVLAAGLLLVVTVGRGSSSPVLSSPRTAAPPVTAVPGQKYQICNQQSQYLTSPWTYHALASGSRSYTVSQYQALPGYGKTLPPLPAYIASQSPATKAAVIYAPGSSVNQPAYALPQTPLLHFFEGGAYGQIGFEAVPGDQFIGGSAPGHREPTFNDRGQASGNQRPERHLRFLRRRQHAGVSSTGRGRNDHNQVAHQRRHQLTDLCRRHDLPHLERLGHHDHA